VEAYDPGANDERIVPCPQCGTALTESELGRIVDADEVKAECTAIRLQARDERIAELEAKLAGVLALANEWDADCEGLRVLASPEQGEYAVFTGVFARGAAAARRKCAAELRERATSPADPTRRSP
jgi:hypothetical protein